MIDALGEGAFLNVAEKAEKTKGAYIE